MIKTPSRRNSIRLTDHIIILIELYPALPNLRRSGAGSPPCGFDGSVYSEGMEAPPNTKAYAVGRAPRQTVSSHDQIVRSLGQDILSGRIAPGEKLPVEADLLERFGVSRTALREAL